ncbi:MAG: cytochrome b561 domain-containing protein [Pseudomonadota bacterium]
MLEWLLAAIDPSRPHEVGLAASWHARFMTLAWGVIAPSAVLIARFLKITPKQNFPAQLDNQFWWRSHLYGQCAVLVLTLVAFAIIVSVRSGQIGVHGYLGYSVLFCLVMQFTLGLCRGSKGGPTDPKPDGSLSGDHYDMTRWRLAFEHLHKTLGYVTLLTAATTIIAGLWLSNAPRWMWIVIIGWWMVLICVFITLQKRGWAIDTYAAIWGTDPNHPGNRRPSPGWGMRRPLDHGQPGE